jgi:hypothetical protein
MFTVQRLDSFPAVIHCSQTIHAFPTKQHDGCIPPSFTFRIDRTLSVPECPTAGSPNTTTPSPSCIASGPKPVTVGVFKLGLSSSGPNVAKPRRQRRAMNRTVSSIGSKATMSIIKSYIAVFDLTTCLDVASACCITDRKLRSRVSICFGGTCMA